MIINPENLENRDAYKLVVGAIVPRAIAFVSTIGEDGVLNLAPFSTYTSVCVKPMIVCFSITPRRDGCKKDTLRNIQYSKDFVINVVTHRLAEAMNKTSADYPRHVDEFEEVGLTPVKSGIVKAPRLGESPINMECKLLNILEFGESPNSANLIIGEVILVHIRDEVYHDGEIQMDKLKPIGRLGGDLYCRINDVFEMRRPQILYDGE